MITSVGACALWIAGTAILSLLCGFALGYDTARRDRRREKRVANAIVLEYDENLKCFMHPEIDMSGREPRFRR